MPDVFYDAQATGANNGTSKADAYTSIAVAYVAAGFANKVFASHTSIEALGADLTFNQPNNQEIISVDFAGSTPPVAADFLKGAKLDGSIFRDINFSGSAPMSFYGLDFFVGDDMRVLGGGARLNNCTIDLSGSGDRIQMATGSLHLNNVNLTAGNIAVGFINATGGYVYWNGGSVDLALTYLLYNFGASDLQMILEGVDLSLIPTLTNAVNSIGSTKLILKGCLLKSGVILHSGAAFGVDSLIALYGSHSSNIPYFIQEQHREGSLITETTIIKSGGSSDGTTPISMKFVTSSEAVRYSAPLEMALPVLFYASTTGIQDFEVDIISSVTLQDDEAFLKASVPGTTIQRDISDSLPANLLTIPSDLPLSSATWDSEPATPVKQTISLTVDVKQVGWVEAHICFAKPSETMYADLKILDGQRQFLAGPYINGEAASTPTQAPEDKVILGTVYNDGNNTGNYKQVPESKGEKDFQWGANGVEFTGTLATFLATYALPQEVILEDEEIIIYEGCNP